MKVDISAHLATDTLIGEHRAGAATQGVFDEIERRAIAGDRTAQRYIGWNLSA